MNYFQKKLHFFHLFLRFLFGQTSTKLCKVSLEKKYWIIWIRHWKRRISLEREYRINCGKYLPWSTRGRLCKWFLLGYWSRRLISALTNYKAWWGKWPPSSAEVRASYWYPLQGWYPERWYRASCNRRTPFS